MRFFTSSSRDLMATFASFKLNDHENELIQKAQNIFFKERIQFLLNKTKYSILSIAKRLEK